MMPVALHPSESIAAEAAGARLDTVAPMRPAPAPYDAILAGRPATVHETGNELLSTRFLTKGLAFTREEREAFGLTGLLPDAVLTIDQQEELEVEHLRRKSDDLERYIGLSALQDRNATLFYRLMSDHLPEFLPIVYTPTVGRACQEFSHILRRTRGTWITPADAGRISEVLRSGPYEDVRLIVVTDNERILGLGDQGAGGMGIPMGKLTLYSAAGIHPALTLPVSLDVGTNNPKLLADPLYVGHRAPRLRGAEYDALVEEFVNAVVEVWPDCIIQWEDFKQQNALRILDRYRERVTSFNDDVQGTSAVVVAGVIAAARALEAPLLSQRIVLAGSGAAGIGIARLLRRLLLAEGASLADAQRAIILVDSKGLVHAGRTDIDEMKRALALPVEMATAYGLPTDGQLPGLHEIVRRVHPTVLVGTTGVGGTFSEAIIREMSLGSDRPVVFPLSNPTTQTEATPEDICRWTNERALIATGSPFPAVPCRDGCHEIGQANNVFVFPGVGLGAMVTRARIISDDMFLVAARTLASHVTAERLECGALFPSVADLRSISHAIAVAVAREAIDSGLARVPADTDVEEVVKAATWRPGYVPYVRPMEA